jgi:NDP-sugar pyrophosphorylase family protein
MDHCSLGDGCTVKSSLLGERCILGPGVALVNSILGDGVVLEGPASLEDETLE